MGRLVSLGNHLNYSTNYYQTFYEIQNNLEGDYDNFFSNFKIISFFNFRVPSI